ncbi:hypothetical protein WR25_09921 [Diploscapter pachys]|uniref:Tetratricopeptide repeat protein n=1 Tax=Diploscapter pachys TaxID=2018661 RepID=A0A2A2J1W9_9BILA|nr:hypothetical protein WR25_09921 [Diploscapter pachys]
MASSYFLQGKYDEVLVYLNSIKAYHQQDDTFSFNLGQTLLMCKQYKEAEEQLLAVTGQERDKILYRSMLARTLIQNRKPHAAWDLYARTKDTKEAFYLLKLIANDYYKAGEYFHAAKAFNQLEKIDPSPEYWQGKRGAACGVFRHLFHGRVTPDQMSEILGLLERDNHPQADFVVSTIRKWAVNHKIDLK